MIKLKESQAQSYEYKGYKITTDDKNGIWKITDSNGKRLGNDFSTDADAQEFIDDTLKESVITENHDDDYFESSLSDILNSAMLLVKEADAAQQYRYKKLAQKIVDVIENF